MHFQLELEIEVKDGPSIHISTISLETVNFASSCVSLGEKTVKISISR